ncbi:disintegrin and metalloproteinase domain-containing protein 9-like [Rhinatrema bivittatum]|uniref:disintegrin and metalloproteinase domain-containing protein 9-like n=1 Tax=Rhinatrema bivittatum TaxID=194408 RepID=UPI00112EAB3D|nr:disintegrin and metalloproteinase domain-containing protein 9-like [Rhinatrema bivittatum]
MDIVVVGMEIWTQKTLINISGDAFEVLEEFRLWKLKNFQNRAHSDVATLVLNRSYGMAYGLANIGAACFKTHSVAFISFIFNSEQIAVNLAHELGHSLFMYHDLPECICSTFICVMNAFMSTATTFSECSILNYSRLIKSGLADCLLNNPSIVFTICGNKLREGNEECDCGSEEECKADPCCGTQCKLRAGMECISGPCCKNCKFINKGQPCRVPVSECDLAEYCSGTSTTCPPDVYSQDGTPCNDGQSICYENTCYDPNRHCQKIFGKEARSASLACFSHLNTIGDRFGNCGYENKKFKKCDIKHVMCGQTKCEDVNKIQFPDKHTAIIQFAAGNTWCWGLDHHLHKKMPITGMRPNGAKCGIKKICMNGRCVSDKILDYDCDVTAKCNGKGVCNNMKNCHCNKEWAPPDCVKPGYGGSIDSGPLVNGSFISYVYPSEEDEEKEKDNGASTPSRLPGKSLRILATVFVVGIPTIVAFIIAFMKRSTIKSWFNQK